MVVYWARFWIGETYCDKVGHTKWPNPLKRFESDEYKIFTKIEILDKITLSHKDAIVARTAAKMCEQCIRAFFPKNFTLEEHFNQPQKTFDGLSGITEMFIIHDIDEFKKVFNTIKQNAWKAIA
jgi:hypothetical protein